MSRILHIETSTDFCSIALSEFETDKFSGIHSGSAGDIGSIVDVGNIKTLYSFVSDKKNEHASTLLLYIKQALTQTGVAFKDLSAIAVDIGPGSYTGLRIGIATAKGLAYALNIPVIGVSPLLAMACGVLKTSVTGTSSLQITANSLNISAAGVNPVQAAAACKNGSLYVPMLDAGRMEVYAAVYDSLLNELMPVQALILAPDTFADIALKHTLVFFGSGSEKFRSVMPDADKHIFIDGIVPTASLMIPIAALEYAAGSFLDTAYFEPLYIKEFIAKPPTVKGL
ncbi:MAG: tRNA (adenosine(37)-N6)-threonylcarbamoyltransferase complex dimerization subunit type 1 TsaB [Bacteroidales bacterium]|jgi:tRNA threonylcarbamoyladenosine biosynthesis protein TsaB|nr:tRNA (adenosine(37)-N6)-threonylcarbamoyltransferase complex dimerization subunit type 1 TsaB [Bacteroidales bacterium]